MSRRKHFKRVWLRNHGAIESNLADQVEKYFDEQARHLASDIEELGYGGESAADAVFRLHDWDQKLRELCEPHLLQGAIIGAEAERAAAGVETEKDATIEIGYRDDLKIDLPTEVVQSIRRNLKESFDSPHWMNIQQTTRNRLVSILTDAAAEGVTLRDLAKRIRERLGRSEERSLTLARTELTGAMNSGHWAARQELIDDGYVTGSEWLATEDGLTRPDHDAANGQVIGKGEQFTVGGEKAPWPGHWSLSARQRVSCRCTTIASGTFAD